MKRLKALFILMFVFGSPAWAQQLLKQSTATTINIGPFISDTDFKTLNSAITVTGMTIRLVKQSDTSAATSVSITPAASSSVNDCVAVTGSIGMYNCELTTTDTNTLGRLDVAVTVSGSLVVFHRFMVVGSTAYDTQVSSVSSVDDLLETDCSTIASSTSPMGKICSGVVAANVTTWNGTAVPAEHTAGYPIVTVKDGTGTGEINTSAGNVSTGAGGTDVNVISWAGTTVATPDTAGYPKVTLKDGTGQGELSITAGQLDGLSTPAQVATAVWAGIPNDAFTAAKFAADVSTEFAATLMATPYEGTETFKTFLRYGAAMLFNNYTSSAGTFSFKDISGAKTRIGYNTTATSRTTTTRDTTD